MKRLFTTGIAAATLLLSCLSGCTKTEETFHYVNLSQVSCSFLGEGNQPLVIEVKASSRSSVKFKRLLGEDAIQVNVPKWLDHAKNTLQGKVVAMPARDDIDFPVEEHLIVELYSK